MVSMKSFKKKISLSSFRKSKKKVIDPIKEEVTSNEERIDDEQENINQNNEESRDDGSYSHNDIDDNSSIDKSPIQDDETTQEDMDDANNLLSPSKEESIKRRVTEAIEKVIADIHSEDLTDDDVSSLLASSLADTLPKEEQEENPNTDQTGQYDSLDDVTNDSFSGYGNSKLCSVFKCEKDSQQRPTYSDDLTESYDKPSTPRLHFCGFFA